MNPHKIAFHIKFILLLLCVIGFIDFFSMQSEYTQGIHSSIAVLYMLNICFMMRNLYTLMYPKPSDQPYLDYLLAFGIVGMVFSIIACITLCIIKRLDLIYMATMPITMGIMTYTVYKLQKKKFVSH